MLEQSDQHRLVIVQINGQDYPIRAQGDEEYIRAVARYVDERMGALEASLPSVSPLKLAVFAALNIADELFTERREKEHLLNTCEEKARHICTSLDEILTLP